MTLSRRSKGRVRALLAALVTALVVSTAAGAAAAPTALDDFATTTAGTPVTFNLFGNDSDPDGGPVSIARFDAFTGANPLLESLSLNGLTGEVTVQPRAPHTGVFGFRYIIEDEDGEVAKAHAQVSVRATDVPTVSGHGLLDDGTADRVAFDFGSGAGTFFLQRSGGGATLDGTVTSATGTGPNATLAGSGTFNGEPGHTFVVTVVEMGFPGALKGDRVGVEVRDAHGTVVYTTSGANPILGGNAQVL